MQESLKRYADDTRRPHGVEVQIRVGLNSGEVVVRSVGSDLRMDYTAVGQTTHLAARMEQLALPGTVRLTGETMRLAEGYVEVRSLGPIPVKGLPGPIEIFELTGVGRARTRLQASALRGLTRFVGRDAEVEHLRRVLGQSEAGRGQVVAIVGEAGVGKSRLTYEFTRSHRVQDWLILEGSSVSYGKATSYLPVIDLLKGYFKIGDRDDHREMRSKILGRVLSLDRALEPLLPPLLALLDVPVEDAAWQDLDPGQRRQRTLDAVKRLLLRESQVQPLLVVFEDLHWIDSETQALLDGLVESLSSVRLLLLVNYRPEYEHRWASKTAYSQLRLDSLPADSAAELLAALLGADPGLVPLTLMLVKRGNPFFLEETVRTLVETGALAGERGAYRLTRPVEALQVPATVQAILAARIDRLPAEEKQLLQAASVIGKDVPYALLAAIADQPEETLRRGLAHLQEAEFLYEAQLFPDLEYTFKHALTHGVAYGGLLHDHRCALHAKIVDTLEALHPDHLMEHVERLAEHAFRGEVWEKAVSYLRQAAAKAFARSANREAVAYLEQALAALAHRPETRETLEQAIDLRFDLRNSLFPLGELEAMLTCLRDAERLARSLDDPRRLGWVSVYMCQYLWVTGHLAEARTFGERALAIAETLRESRLQAVASYYVGAVCFSTNDYRLAEDCLRKAIRALDGDLGRERFGLAGSPAVMSRWLLASSLAERGEFDEGLVHGQEGLRIAEEVDHPYSLILAFIYGLKGDFGLAGAQLERALALCHDWNIPVLSPITAGFLGYVSALSGRVGKGLSSLQEGTRAQESGGLRIFHSLLVGRLGEVFMLAGRIEDALAQAERALMLTRERGERGFGAWALRLLGELACRCEPPEVESAGGHYRQAMTLAEELELGMRPLVAHCHLVLGRLYWRTDKFEETREHLTRAAAMYREMGMGYWLHQAETEMKELE